jgi:DNA mismatch repair protein MutS2
MDAHALRVLEFDKIRQQLADCAACSLGKRRAEALRPATDAEWIIDRLKETTEARETVARHGTPPFGGLTDVSGLLRKAASGSTLAGEEVRLVADALRAARLMKRYFDQTEEDVGARLGRLAETLYEDEDFEERVERTIDDEGEVRDDASDELRSLRRRHATLHERLQAILGGILAREAGGTVLQERLIVQRSGRYCIPVRASAQSKFRGLVHDRSDSGVTVFMEPLEAVEPGNELRETELAIDEEKRRLLEELSGAVAAIADGVTVNLRTLGILDFAFAKARLAGRMSATEPAIAEPGTFHLVRARHPLLTGEVVPNDVWIGKHFDALVITGPNTGGKTVVLRTVGLLALMLQSGLHIPAGNGSEMAVFEHIFADIGDEQSIEQSLSTFSSHMTQIIRLVQKLRARARQSEGRLNALVLLDEIGAGTDPTEGSALARAILEELQHLGARTLATTHYNELKAFAYGANGMENASVEFDVKTLKPTFRLLIGQPGASNAFEIAQRLGLPKVIAQRARALVDSDDLLVEDVIRRMEHSQRRLQEEAGLAAEERAELEELRQEYGQRLEELNARRRQAVEEGFGEARRIVAEAEERAREIIADLQRQPRQSKVTEQRRQEIAELRDEVERRAVTHERESHPPEEPAEEAAAKPAFEAAPGDAVHVRSLDRDGVLLRLTDTGRALVEVGKMRVEVAPADLAPPKVPIGDEHRAIAEKLQIAKSLSVAPEINLIGTTVDEATVELEKYLDDAFLAGLPSVRIIHGKGTGALRRGIHEYLRRSRHVRSFSLADRDEGGEGATVVEL